MFVILLFNNVLTFFYLFVIITNFYNKEQNKYLIGTFALLQVVDMIVFFLCNWIKV